MPRPLTEILALVRQGILDHSDDDIPIWEDDGGSVEAPSTALANTIAGADHVQIEEEVPHRQQGRRKPWRGEVVQDLLQRGLAGARACAD